MHSRKNGKMTQQAFFISSTPLDTQYSQMYVSSPNYPNADLSVDAFRGQVNGLCGGAVPGGLFLRIGCWGGTIPFTVEVRESAPPIDSSWDEIVEASCSFDSLPASLQGWDGDQAIALPLALGDYRARFCATGYAASETPGSLCDPAVERYALILWPEARRPDDVLKQQSALALYLHSETRARQINAGSH